MQNLGAIGITLAALAMALLANAAHADFDCKLYTGPLPAKQIGSDTSLSYWLKTIHSDCNPSDWCSDGKLNQLKLVGSFGSDWTHHIVFKNVNGEETTFKMATPDKEEKANLGTDCSFIIPKMGNNNTFSCYDGGNWSSNVSVMPGDSLPGSLADAISQKKISSLYPSQKAVKPYVVDENTRVLVLGQGPNKQIDGANSELFFAGNDCGKVAKSEAWNPKSVCAATVDGDHCGTNEFEDFYKAVMTSPKESSAVIDNSTTSYKYSADLRFVPKVQGPAGKGGTPGGVSDQAL